MMWHSFLIFKLVEVARVLRPPVAACGLQTLNLVTFKLAVNAPSLCVLNRSLAASFLPRVLLILLLLLLLELLVALRVVARVITLGIAASHLSRVFSGSLALTTTTSEDVILRLMLHERLRLRLLVMLTVHHLWRLLAIATNLVLVVFDGAYTARRPLMLLIIRLRYLRKGWSHSTVSLLLLLLLLHFKRWQSRAGASSLFSATALLHPVLLIGGGASVLIWRR